MDLLDNNRCVRRVLHLEFGGGQNVLHLQAQIGGARNARLLADHRELRAGEMGLVVIAGLRLGNREGQADLVGGRVLFYIRINYIPVILGRKSVDFAGEGIVTNPGETGRPESVAIFCRMNDGQLVTFNPYGAVSTVGGSRFLP